VLSSATVFGASATSASATSVGVSVRCGLSTFACARRSIPPKLRQGLTGGLRPRRLSLPSSVGVPEPHSPSRGRFQPPSFANASLLET
jgi:hypothetical protein